MIISLICSSTSSYMHDIHNYSSSVRISTQLFTPTLVCVLILYMSSGTYSFKSNPNNTFFEKFYLFTEFLLRWSHRRNFFFSYFVLWEMSDLKSGTVALHLISQYTYLYLFAKQLIPRHLDLDNHTVLVALEFKQICRMPFIPPWVDFLCHSSLLRGLSIFIRSGEPIEIAMV